MLLRANVWISLNGVQNSAYSGVSFPYTTKLPSSGKKAEIKGISDIYDEIIRIGEESELKGFKVGESIYGQIGFFADCTHLISDIFQQRIKEYSFCKTFSCPPYPSLDKTPPNIVDDFLIIEEEYNQYILKKNMENQNA